MRITVLAGGVGGARFLLGMRERLAQEPGEHELTAVVNTGDDAWVAGLRITPDLDSIMYALAGVNDTVRGWGRAGESERVSAELTAWGVGWPWFTLGDLDLGAHIARTSWLREGLPLSTAVERLTARWPLGARLLPATDDEVETWVRVADDDGTERAIHFQEWWVRHRSSLPAVGFEHRGQGSARPAPGVREAIADADVVVLAPSNPVVSVGPILGIPGITEAVRAASAPVVGVSPIIGGAVVRGMADACLAAIGVETSADAVAGLYGPRAAGGVLDGWLVDEVDAALTAGIAASGMAVRAVPLWMRDPQTSAALAGEVLALAREVRQAG
ncbi:2-phospho-L-lactate transferase [Protaetiibacter mangrovi]|uniref:2-phospho-L-lactate transferase n=1 Tax=Protaetiibacter mangrovi TaxID=2970926 RepID=A0ABT1ZI48_9MICO|nr:2-phospho-L-lactate transferase [Protaetiibacter mangrovi]MCS0500394.1 2-phospho-L-lactate transferase [Protaetiibacter mangrovi]TPX05321.1 2-phospho-L-lactate transferase [Schumannella luteola]